MKVQTFVGKVQIETVRNMDEHIVHWIEKNKVEPKQINQFFGYERLHAGDLEPVIITSIWY